MLHGPITLIAHIRISNITVEDVARAINEGRKYGDYGAGKTAITLRKILKFITQQKKYKIAIDWRDIDSVRAPYRKVQYLTADDIRCIRRSIDVDTPLGLRTRVLFELLLHTGLRIGEALSLDIDNVDLHALTITVKNNKNNHMQIVAITPTCAQWISIYLQSRFDGLPYLFVDVHGRRRLLSVTARASLKKIQKKCNLNKRIHWHILRKTFVTNLLHSGVDIRTTQHLARHQSVVTTLRHYAAINHSAEQYIVHNIIDRM